MRASHLAAALAAAALATPLEASAWVVVRAGFYHPVAAVAVVSAAAYSAPVYATPYYGYPYYAAPVTVAAPAPPPAPALNEKVPVNTTMWTLPSGCTPVSASGKSYFLCGPNWLTEIKSDKGNYYAVVAPP
jgi:hypothetical protein